MIKGTKVELHALGKKELINTLKWKNDPELKPLIGTVYPISMEEHKRWFDKIAKAKDIKYFAIKDKRGSHIGNINLRINWKDRNAEFGMIISKEAQGHGYGPDALNTLLGFAFHELNLHRIGCQVFEYNKAAVRVYEKSGFRIEGIQREALFCNNRYHNIIFMGLLKKEYKR